MEGGQADFPPIEDAETIIGHLQALGLCSSAGMGRFPIPPERLQAWSHGTCTELSPGDFEDILELSAVYCAACVEYDNVRCNPPFERELTQEEQIKADAAVERAMDLAMGV